ncbi:hypothetical protein [Roseivivax marinus]|uniref:hypothetical protein n=1 Tax=Roseivivax marinus TaxID=1379903 RepID=UPI00138E2E71|nr:hypothetical protein [Roseivivax marinus]
MTEDDADALETDLFWELFRKHLHQRFSDEFLDGEEFGIELMVGLAVNKFRFAAQRGNTGAEAGLDAAMSVMFNEVDPTDPAHVFAETGLMFSRLLAEEILEKRISPYIRKIPILGDAAAGATIGIVEVGLDGWEGGAVVIVMTFFALQDAAKEYQELVLNSQYDNLDVLLVPPPPPPDMDRSGMRCTTIGQGLVQIETCLPDWSSR